MIWGFGDVVDGEGKGGLMWWSLSVRCVGFVCLRRRYEIIEKNSVQLGFISLVEEEGMVLRWEEERMTVYKGRFTIQVVLGRG